MGVVHHAGPGQSGSAGRSRRPAPRQPSLVLAAALFAGTLCAGCGGEEAAPKIEQPAGARVVERKQPRGRAAQRAKNAQRDKQSIQDGQSKDEIFTSADPGDVFVIANSEPNFEIVADGLTSRGADEFKIFPPPPGDDSSTFFFAEPAGRAAAPPVENVALPENFTPLPEKGYSADGLPLRIRCEKDGSLMALVPAGEFVMGSNDGPSHCRPELAVYLDAYYIDITEVTVAQHDMYINDIRRTSLRRPAESQEGSPPPNYPITEINWGEARLYARWAGKQLPTEAQWEKAARSGRNFDHPWGNGRAVWHRSRSREQIDGVASYRMDVSPYGVYDMAGNVREWCHDWYRPDAYEQALSQNKGKLHNWKGPTSSGGRNDRVVKGNAPDWNVWHRDGSYSHLRRPDLGFRCVLSIEGSNDGRPEQSRGR